MKPEQQFDKNLRKKMESAEEEFAFNEADWQKASKMMDAERAALGSKLKKVLLLSASVFLILGSIVFLGYKYIGTETNNNLAQSSSQKTNFNETRTTASVDYLQEINNENSDALPKKENFIDAKLINSSAKELNKTTGSNSDAELLSNPSLNNSTSNSGKIVASKLEKVYNSSSQKYAFASYEDNNVRNQEQQTSLNKEQAVNNSENAGSNMYENFYLKTKISVLPEHLIEGDIKNTSYDFIRIYDEDYYKTKKRKLHYFEAEAGTAYMFGWNNPKGTDAKGFNAYAGLNYGFLIKKHFSASIGAQVYNIGNVTKPFFTASDVSYDFGSNGTFTTVTTNSLIYFSLPVKINYAINKRNSIGIGVNTAFLFNGKNTIETYNMADGVKSNVKQIHNTGFYEGTNTTNVMLTASYSRAVSSRIKLNTELVFGLSDIYKNTESNVTFENSKGIRIGLQYILFK
ncbi:MAG: PorT family protein [Bacteroidetes bacterium]|nr:PorT family protein [Bacteroidota bacterium]